MIFVCKGKAWPKALFSLYELLVVNIDIVKRSSGGDKTPGDVYRWTLLRAMVKRAADLESTATPEATPRRSLRQRGRSVPNPASETSDNNDTADVPRFEGVHKHHLCTLHEYVTPEQARINEKIAQANPTKYKCNHRKPRLRDELRKVNKSS